MIKMQYIILLSFLFCCCAHLQKRENIVYEYGYILDKTSLLNEIHLIEDGRKCIVYSEKYGTCDTIDTYSDNYSILDRELFIDKYHILTKYYNEVISTINSHVIDYLEIDNENRICIHFKFIDEDLNILHNVYKIYIEMRGNKIFEIRYKEGIRIKKSDGTFTFSYVDQYLFFEYEDLLLSRVKIVTHNSNATGVDFREYLYKYSPPKNSDRLGLYKNK